MISPVVRWEHGDDWFVTKFELQRSTRSGERKVKVALSGEDYDFIVGHAIDGRTILEIAIISSFLEISFTFVSFPKIQFHFFHFFRSCSVSGHCVFATCMGNTGVDEVRGISYLLFFIF